MINLKYQSISWRLQSLSIHESNNIIERNFARYFLLSWKEHVLSGFANQQSSHLIAGSSHIRCRKSDDAKNILLFPRHNCEQLKDIKDISADILGPLFLVFYFQYPQEVVWRRSAKKLFINISQNSKESTGGRVSFLIKLQAKVGNFIKKETVGQMFFCVLRNF